MITLIIIQHARRHNKPTATHTHMLRIGWRLMNLKFKRHLICNIRTLMEFERCNSEQHYYEPLPQMIHETEVNLPRIEFGGDEGSQSWRRRYCRRCCGAEKVGFPWSERSPWCREEGRAGRDRAVALCSLEIGTYRQSAVP